MSRGPILFSLGAAFLGAGLLGFLAATQLGPQHLEAALEQALSSALETEVELSGVEIALVEPWPRIRLDTRDATAWPAAGGPGLQVESIHARIDPIGWFRGQDPIESVVLEGPIFRPRGVWPPDPDEEPSETPVVDLVEHFEGLGAWLRAHLCPLPPIDVMAGAIKSPGEDEETLLIDVQGSLRCEPGRLARLGLKGQTQDGGDVDLRVDGQRGGREMNVGIHLEGAEAKSWKWLLDPIGLSGQVTGRLAWKNQADLPQLLTVALRGPRLALVVPRKEGPSFRTSLVSSELHAEIAATQEELTLGHAQWNDGDLALRAEGALGLPIHRESDLRLALATDRLELGEARRRVQELPAETREPLELALDRIEEGRLERVRVETRTRVSDWGELLGGEFFGRRGAVGLEFAVVDATMRVGATDRMTGIGAEFAFRGDEAEIRGLHGNFRGEPLPRLDARVQGLSQIHSSAEPLCLTPRDVPPLPGLEAAQTWIRSRRDEPNQGTWQEVRIAADWLAHPALLCTVEQLRASIRPSEAGAAIHLERGVWANLPIEGHAELIAGPNDDFGAGRVEIALKVGAPFEAMQPDLPDQSWGVGQFEIDATQVGDWQIQGAKGSFELHGSRLELRDTTLALAPEGIIRGRGTLNLGSEAPVPFDAGIQLEALPIQHLWKAATLGDASLTGALHGAIAVQGSLVNGLPPLANAHGVVTLQARDGLLHRRLPVLLAITIASDRWNPFGERDRLRYQAIDLVARVEAGHLVSETLTIDAPTFRVGAAGRLEVENPHQLEAVAGIFFFPALDRIIDRLPLVNRVLLGSNRNLVGAYFALEGAVKKPKARIVPVKSITEMGPANFVIDGLPEFVWGGIRRIQSVLLPRADAPQPKQERADS